MNNNSCRTTTLYYSARRSPDADWYEHIKRAYPHQLAVTQRVDCTNLVGGDSGVDGSFYAWNNVTRTALELPRHVYDLPGLDLGDGTAVVGKIAIEEWLSNDAAAAAAAAAEEEQGWWWQRYFCCCFSSFFRPPSPPPPPPPQQQQQLRRQRHQAVTTFSAVQPYCAQNVQSSERSIALPLGCTMRQAQRRESGYTPPMNNAAAAAAEQVQAAAPTTTGEAAAPVQEAS